jgi:hypothetical protein
VSKPWFLLDVLQRKERRCGVFVAEVRLVSQLVGQTVVVVMVVSGGDDVATGAGCCA